MSKWSELLGSEDAGPAIDLGVREGQLLPTQPPLPAAEVVKAVKVDVKHLFYHVVQVKAMDEHGDREEDIAIGRLVAVTEQGAEIEFEREAHPVDAVSGEVNVSRCDACGGEIHGKDSVILCFFLSSSGRCGAQNGAPACEYEREGDFDKCRLCSRKLAYHRSCTR